MEYATNPMDHKESNEKVLQEADLTRSLMNRICKPHSLFGHVMRREKLTCLVTTGMIDGKSSRRKQKEKVLNGLTKWLNVGQVTDALKVTRN